MPVGRTTDEVYDRFNYPDASGMSLDFNVQDYNNYRKGS